MMLTKNKSGGILTISQEERIDISIAPMLEREVKEGLDGVTELVVDLEKLACIFSAGLRMLLLAQKKMDKQGSLKAIHVNDAVMETLVIIGFTVFMTIEREKN